MQSLRLIGYKNSIDKLHFNAILTYRLEVKNEDRQRKKREGHLKG
jgi:hypothetical protein